MRNSIVITLLSAVLFTASAIPWPVGVTPAGQDSSWSIFNSYGNFHGNGSWEGCTDTTLFANFHFGVDIKDYINFGPPDTVRCVRDGWVTDRLATYITTKADSQYTVVICDLISSPDGWCYQHMDSTYFSEGDHVDSSSAISVMEPLIDNPHLHFMRSLFEYDSQDPGLLNPLDSLIPPASADSGFTWEFTESSDTLFFLEQMNHFDWPQYIQGNQDSVWKYQVEPDSIHNAVDLFYAYWLTGDGTKQRPMNNDPLNPHRIKWTASKYMVSDTSEVLTRYVVEFSGELGSVADTTKYRQFYFRWARKEWLFGTPNYGLISCLTNCGDAEDWDGINNIEENCWQTDSDNQFTGVTTNPVLAAFPDGPYLIDVFSYAYDTTVVDTASIDIKLHNFSPVVERVVISCEGTTVWEAYWTADGLTPEWHNPVDLAVLPDQELDLTVVFTEPMDTTSVTVTAGVYSPYNDITASDTGLNWSWTNCPEEPEYKDTWHGVFDDLTGCTFGRMTISIQAQDHDANGLMDPSIPCVDGTDYNDTHHSFSVMGVQAGWPVTLHDYVKGSPVLADLDEDGDLDVIIQCTDGYVHILADDGSTWNSNWPMHSGGWGYINVKACPSIVDLDDDGDLDVLSVHAYGCHARDVATGSSLSGWPVDMGVSGNLGFYPSMSSPAIGDVDGDGHPEVVICRHLSGSTTVEATVYLYEHTGVWRTWARNLEPSLYGSSVTNTPAIGDVSSSHPGNEIVVCTSEGYYTGKEFSDEKSFNSAVYLLDPADGSDIWKSITFECYFFGSPVVADIDGDGINEIIIGTHIDQTTDRVLVLNGDDGTLEHTFYVNSTVTNSVGIADLNDDGILDIVAVDNTGHVYCWSGEGYQSLPGFPVTVEGIPAAPSIVNIDADSDLEIVVGTNYGYLYAINSDGSICSGYPVSCGNGIEGQVALGNIDDDDGLELIFADDTDPTLYCYDLGAGSFPAMMPWRQFQHDSWHTGCFEADNTIPEPPTNLSGEITYNGGNCEVDLEWDLSVNDPSSGSPEEPTDVIGYLIYRIFKPISMANPKPVGKVRAGNSFFTDIFDSSCGSGVVYWVKAFDGTNESECSNHIKFPTSPSDVISLGCSVVEEFSIERASIGIPDRAQVVEMDESSNVERTSIRERTAETVPAAILRNAVPSNGNPYCLTDGSVEVRYTPSSGADAVVIDIGEECTVTSVIPERISDNSPDVITMTDEYVLNVETAPVVEPSLSIEVAGSDRVYHPFLEEFRNGTDAVRYVRIRGASGLTEVSVYGERESVNAVSSVEITRSAEDEGWMFAIPVVEYSEEASVNIYDVSGRMIWSGHAESGTVLHWDGFTENGTAVPNGVYLLHCSIGSDVSTGSFVVRRD